MTAILVFCCISGFAQTVCRTIDSTERIVTIGSLLDSARVRYNMFIHADPGILDISQKVKVSTKVPLDSTIASVLKGKGLEGTRVGGTFWIKKILPPPSLPPSDMPVPDTVHVDITVTDSKGEKLPGVNITAKNSGQTLTTDEEGKVHFQTWIQPDTLYFSYVGMELQRRIVRQGGPFNIQIRMQTQFVSLDESIVSNYTSTTKATYTGNRIQIDDRQLNRASDLNFQDALSGSAPGVRVLQTSGFAGSSQLLTLEGNPSIVNGRDPTYIIDHVPYASGNKSVSNIPSGSAAHSLNPLSMFSIDDIERIEILKDADATAIYGSRGANGVMLITTRQGKNSKKPRFSFEMDESISGATRRLHLMNMQEYWQMRLSALQNDGLSVNTATAPDLTRWNTLPSADWSKWLTGGQAHQTRLRGSISGGNDTNRYYLGLSGLAENNIFPLHPTHQLLTGDGNLHHRSPDGKLDIQLSGLFGRDRNNQFINDPTMLQFLVPVELPLLNPQNKPLFSYNGVPIANPWSLLLQPYTALSHNYLADAFVSYRLFPALTILVNLGYSKVESKEYSQIPISSMDTSGNPTASSYFAQTFFRNRIMEPQLEYKKDSGKFKYSMLAGSTWQMQGSGMSTLTATGFTTDSFLRQPALAPLLVPDSLAASYSYTAYFARITGNWMDRYILNLTGRRDGSSRFGPGKQFGNFWAAGFAWVFSNEKFAGNVYPVLSFGKLRASYGITGNDQVGAYGQGENWAPTGTLTFQSIPGSYSPTMVRSGQTWETIHKLEIALELGLLKNRIFFTGAWYRHLSSNQLLPESFPLTGKTTIFRNWPAVLENRGWEFTLLSRNIDGKHFQWTTSFNASLPVNRLLAFPQLSQSPFSKVLIIGQSITVQQALRYQGVNSSSGLYQFEDRNGDGRLTEADRSVVGNLDVTAFAGLENTFHLDRFQLQFTIVGELQTGSNYQDAIYSANPPGSILSGFYSNETKDVLNSWHRSGDHAPYQQLTTKYTTLAGKQLGNYISSSAMLVDASYARLKNLLLSYQLPPGFLKKNHLLQARVFIEGQNLLTLSPYKGPDPEIQSILTAPPLRTVLLGVHLEF